MLEGRVHPGEHLDQREEHRGDSNRVDVCLWAPGFEETMRCNSVRPLKR